MKSFWGRESMDCLLFGRKSQLRIQFIFAPVLAFLLISCAKQDTEMMKVFPELTPSCESTAHKTRFVIKKKDGTIYSVNAKSRDDLIKNHLEFQLEDLELVENDQIIQRNDYFLRNDINPAFYDTWGAERINAPYAWSKNIKGKNVVVAVIDSGVDITHPALSSKIYINEKEMFGFPGVDDDGNGYVDDVRGWDFAKDSPYNDDSSGHGTHVAGVIASAHTSSVKGIAPDAKILPLDFMNGNNGYTSDAINAILYAKQMKAQVINASWGSSFCSKILNTTIDSLNESNTIFVAAAGNSGNDLSRYPEYPAAFISNVQITVGAITRRGFQTYFSNYGNLVDVVAPGDEINSTYLSHGYRPMSGTSMAAPFVSGLAALIYGVNPNLTVSEVKSIINQSVVPGNFQVRTRGEINVAQALGLLGL